MRRRALGIATMGPLLGVALTGCVTVGGGGPSQADAAEWTRSTSSQILDAIAIDTPPLSADEREGVCAAIDYSTERWNSWSIETTLPMDPNDQQPLLDRVTQAFDRDGWRVLGDDPGEIGPESQAQFERGLLYTSSIDDQGADVTISPDRRTVRISVSSACYVS